MIYEISLANKEVEKHKIKTNERGTPVENVYLEQV